MKRRGIVALLAGMAGALAKAQGPLDPGNKVKIAELESGTVVFRWEPPSEYAVLIDMPILLSCGGESFLLTPEDIAKELQPYRVARSQ